jgi:4-hydroxybenzoate polyprenyltransferase
LVAVFVLGTILMRSAGCCINDVADRDFDRHVKRTAERPVTRGAVSVREALLVGAVLALAAFGFVLTTNPATIAWSFAGLAVTLIYPYAKRYVSMPQAVLGVAFSFGIPLAFVAVGSANLAWPDISLQTLIDAVPMQAWGLMLFNLFWVLAYDTEYAMVDRDDDIRIGMKTSAITLGRHDISAIMAFYAVYLCGWYGLLESEKLGSAWTFALILASLQALWHFLLILDRSRDGCFRAFRLNHWLGATVFAGVALGYAMR